MIDLMHRYALLEDGTIEPLQYYDGEPRDAYQGEDGLYYFDHDVWDEAANVRFNVQRKHSRILRTGNDRHELEVLTNGETT